MAVSVDDPPRQKDWDAIPVVPNSTVCQVWWEFIAIQCRRVDIYFTTGPSTAGSYTLRIQRGDTNADLLSTSAFDLTTVASDTVTSLALTATTDDLDLPSRTKVLVTITSDNVDLTGDGLRLALSYRGITSGL